MPTPTLTRALTVIRARAKVLAREDRKLRSELVRLRRAQALTQAHIADRMGVTQQAVHKLERYDTDIKLSTLRRYANAIGALIEHRVTLDEGQSLLLASGPQWKATRTEWSFVPTESTFPSAMIFMPSFAEWSEPRRTDFTVAA